MINLVNRYPDTVERLAALQVWAHVVSLGLASIGAWEEREGLENGG